MKYIISFGKRCVKLVRNIISGVLFSLLVILLAAVAIAVVLSIAAMFIAFFTIAPILAFFGVGSSASEKLEKFANELKNMAGETATKAGKSATIHPFKKKDDDD